MSNAISDDTRDLVRDHYAKVSTGNAGCAPGCCAVMPADQSKMLGYSEDERALGEGADLGLGCGNPTAIASLRPGETVLDLGSGGGFDSFLAARAVGPAGKVIGVDMTPEMITLSRTNARKLAAVNVEFRLGEIEHLPVADGTIDVILSNCVINLSPDKQAVFDEAFRVLRVGGRLAIHRLGEHRGPSRYRRLLRARLLSVTPAPWQDVAARLRPFIARRVSPAEIDDVMQDVFVRMQRGLPALRDEERFTSWLFQIARSSIAEHARTRARHPLPDHEPLDEAEIREDDDRQAARALAGCIAMFVAQLASPYREAITLVELEGLTAREAAVLAGISISGMKSRVQRGREQLRALFEACCEIALDARGKPTDFSPRCKTCR